MKVMTLNTKTKTKLFKITKSIYNSGDQLMILATFSLYFRPLQHRRVVHGSNNLMCFRLNSWLCGWLPSSQEMSMWI